MLILLYREFIRHQLAEPRKLQKNSRAFQSWVKDDCPLNSSGKGLNVAYLRKGTSEFERPDAIPLH
jgi:hypothetical protein